MPSGLPWLFVVLWSLCVEAMFYVSLPLFARLSKGHELASVIILAVPSVIFSQIMGGLDLPRMLPATPFYAPGWWWAFAPGMILALVERDHPGLLRPRPLMLGGILLLGAEFVFLYRCPPQAGDFVRSALLVTGAVAIMASVIHWQPGRGVVLAALAADISYPFYLWHVCPGTYWRWLLTVGSRVGVDHYRIGSLGFTGGTAVPTHLV